MYASPHSRIIVFPVSGLLFVCTCMYSSPHSRTIVFLVSGLLFVCMYSSPHSHTIVSWYRSGLSCMYVCIDSSPHSHTIVSWYQDREVSMEPWNLFAAVSFSYVGAMVASNSSLAFINYPTQVITCHMTSQDIPHDN